jgi:KUP system potassium uptake protein
MRRSYRCIVRYGYRDVHQDVDSFESELFESLSDFIRLEGSEKSLQQDQPLNEDDSTLTVIGTCRRSSISVEIESDEDSIEPVQQAVKKKKVRFLIEKDNGYEMDKLVQDELGDLYTAKESGIAFILGHSHVQTKPGSSVFRKLAIDFGYNFLRRNCRGPDVALKVPPASLLEVGMVYVL